MTDYTKTTDFTSKDSLPSGDSGKIIRGAEFGTEFDNIQTAVNSKSNTDNPTFTGTITGNGSGLTNVAAASIDLTVSSDTDADYNVPFMNATGDGGSAKVLQVDDNGLMFNPNSNTLSVNRLKGSNDNLLIQDTSGNTILDIDAGALEIPVNTTITGTTAVTGNITVTGTVDGRDVAADGIKLDTVETNADVTDTDNVTAAGALMDNELTSIASVKALNQGVATTDSPTFAGVTANGTVEFDGLSGTGAITVTDILDQDDMSGNSATALATQQSIKAYVDSQVGTVDTLAEVLANGNATGGTDIAFGDNDKATFGADDDLQIYHDGSNSFIDDTGTGSLVLQSNGAFTVIQNSSGVANARFDSAGAASIRYNGVEKLATTTTGIDVTGTATMDGLSVDGSASTTGVLTLGSAGVANAFINSADSLYINIDSNNDQSGGNDFQIARNSTGTAGQKIFLAGENGNVQFFEDTGATPKFHWDAADEALGIGTTNPRQDLEIFNGDTGSGIRLAATATAYWDIERDPTSGHLTFTDDGAGTVLTVGQNGLVGIGTDDPAQPLHVDLNGRSTAYKYLQLDGDGGLGSVSGQAGVGFRPIGAGNNVHASINALEDGLASYKTELTFNVNKVNSDSAPTEAMRIDSSGRVGIGTDTPTSNYGKALHIHNTGTGSSLHLTDGTSGLGASDGTDFIHYGNDSYIINRESLGTMRFFTASSEAVRIDSSGNVGIGTDNPSTKLHVNAGTGNIAATFESTDAGSYINLIDSASGTYGAMIGASGDDIVFSPNNVEAMRIDSDGKVGIGTSNPAFAASRTGINIKGTTANGVEALLLDNTDTGHAGFALVKDGVDAFIYNRTNGIIGFGTNNTERLRITSTGKVGIGTDDPSETLTVSGNIQIEDNDGYLQFKDANGGTNNKFRRIYNSAQDLFISRRNDDGSLEANDLVIDSSGNVGIGTSTPNFYGKTAIKGGKAGNADSNLSLLTSGDAQGEDANLAFYGTFVGTADNGPRRTADITSGFEGGNWGTEYLSFSVGKSGSSNDTRALTNEAMRIDGSQNLLVGRTSASGVDTDGHVLFKNGVSYQSMTDNAAQFVNRNGTGDGPITSFYKNGNSVGSIGTEGGALYISSPYGNDSGLRFVSGIVGPATTTGANRDGAIDLGYDNGRFKDLYLSGGAYLGGTGSANKLDDYEEGTWTPTLVGNTTAGTYSISATNCTYTKIGRQVTVQGQLTVTVTSAGTGLAKFDGLPFTSDGAPVAVGGVRLSNVTLPASTVYVAGGLWTTATTAFGISLIRDSATPTSLDVSGISTGDVVRISMTYFTS